MSFDYVKFCDVMNYVLSYVFTEVYGMSVIFTEKEIRALFCYLFQHGQNPSFMSRYYGLVSDIWAELPINRRAQPKNEFIKMVWDVKSVRYRTEYATTTSFLTISESGNNLAKR